MQATREEYKEEYTHSGPISLNTVPCSPLNLLSPYTASIYTSQFGHPHTHKHGLVFTPIWVSLLFCNVCFGFGCNTNPCFLWIPSLSLPTSGVATFPIPEPRKRGFPRAVQKTKKAILVKSELFQNGDS